MALDKTKLGLKTHVPQGSLPVPLVDQETNYSCGAAALASVLHYWMTDDEGLDRLGETDLHDDLGTNSVDGTEMQALVGFASQAGLDAEYRDALEVQDLHDLLAAGDTAILGIQAWAGGEEEPDWESEETEGHYVVLVGLDGVNAYFMDPSTDGAYAYVSIDDLLERWHDVGEDGVRLEHPAVVISGAEALGGSIVGQPAERMG